MSLIKDHWRVSVLFIFLAYSSATISEEALFSTWEGFEADKCASIWLIKRFIAPQAEVRFYPREAIIEEGVAFDTPEAKFRRYHNKSTFETLLDHYRLTDGRLVYIGKIIHDLEINIWRKKVMAETMEVQGAVRGIISETDNKKIMVGCRSYFDEFYNQG